MPYSGVGSCLKLGERGEVIRTHLYGEKLHSYEVTVKTGGLSPLFSAPYELP